MQQAINNLQCGWGINFQPLLTKALVKPQPVVTQGSVASLIWFKSPTVFMSLLLLRF